jgi:glycerophosphoryl diester phosphodiesterase
MSDTYKIIDNFLDRKTLNEIKNITSSTLFPWYYNDGVSSSGDDDFYFTHIFYNNYSFQSSFTEPIILPLLEKIQPRSLIRIKGNLYPNTKSRHTNNSHVDYNFDHYGAIYYINSNDGHTILDDGTMIESIENRLLLFNPSVPHRSTHCTDENYRMNINFNYF